MSKGDAVGVPHSVVLEILKTRYDIGEVVSVDDDDEKKVLVSVEISGLPSYDDQNFRVKRTIVGEGKVEQFVLKVANKFEVYGKCS